MNINLTPEIQMEIYRDKQTEYTIRMLEKLTEKLEYTPENKEEDKDEKSFFDDDKEKEPWIKDSTYGSSSYFQQKNLNSNLNTESFFSTLSSVGSVSGSSKDA